MDTNLNHFKEIIESIDRLSSQNSNETDNIGKDKIIDISDIAAEDIIESLNKEEKLYKFLSSLTLQDLKRLLNLYYIGKNEYPIEAFYNLEKYDAGNETIKEELVHRLMAKRLLLAKMLNKGISKISEV